MNQIALISTPWPLFNRPSIQLGALKAFVIQELPHLQVHAHHFYLSVAGALGYDLYGKISEKTWLAESLYAALLYPERMATIKRFWKRRSSRVYLSKNTDFNDIYRVLKMISTPLLDHETWDRYLLAGLSICFGQMTSSLYFIREIKQRAPDIKIVVGGSLCAGDMGVSILNTFPEIDFVASGEGEVPLVSLIKSLEGSQGHAPESPIPGLLSRHEKAGPGDVSQVPNLDELPIPDYSDYFKRLRSHSLDKMFLPRLPMEISRGCWWQKKMSPHGGSGCAFCNLNLQWQGYRAKSNDRVIEELEALSNEYQILSLSFMDNLLPARELEPLFKRIQGLGKDFRFFSELRATTTRKVLAAMGAAGMGEVQVGIESLSSGLLKKLNKGTTAMDNMEIMKNCETPGFPTLTGNLILCFPTSDKQDVAETLDNLAFAFPFRPLKGIPFWLGYGSSVWQMPHDYGIKKIRNHPFYSHLFPPEVLRGLRLMIQGYQGDVRYQNRLWRPVREKLEEWRKAYLGVHQTGGAGPILSYQDGLEFMIIRERRAGKDDMTHKLRGTSRKIYLFCQTQRSMSQILNTFPGFEEEKIGAFLRMMIDKHLMFNEGDLYLSLAVPTHCR